MKIKIIELELKPYADTSLGQPNYIHFDLDDIKVAIQEKHFDNRSFQDDLAALLKEWNDNSNNYVEYLERSRRYHIERIAYLIETDKWKFPIIVEPDLKTIIDGQHRVWAAKYLNEEEIEANV